MFKISKTSVNTVCRTQLVEPSFFLDLSKYIKCHFSPDPFGTCCIGGFNQNSVDGCEAMDKLEDRLLRNAPPGKKKLHVYMYICTHTHRETLAHV